MSPVDWSWGETYDSPTFVSPIQPTPTTADASNMNEASMQTSGLDAKLFQNMATSTQFSKIQSIDAQQPPQSQLKTSRKRSRDEMTEGLDDGDSDDSNSSANPFPSARPTPSPPKNGAGSRPEPILGPGMTLIYPDDDSSWARAQMDAGSQTGTWAEELSERLRSSSMRETNQRPPLESRKSLRLDREVAAKMDDVASAAVAADPRVKISFGSENPSDNIGPTVDEASLTLGVAWSCIPSNSTMEAATRGWARHIEARFPLQTVRFVWINKSIPAYLVCALTCDGRERSPSPPSERGLYGLPVPTSYRTGSQGYYLFDESLSQGRLVATSWERTVENLRSSPIVFDGDQTMDSAESADQPHRGSPVIPMHSLQHNSADDGVIMMDENMDEDSNHGVNRNNIAVAETKYWAGWGKPSVPALYPQRSLNSCSPFENHSQQQHMAPMIEVGGASVNMVGGDGMDLDY